MKKELENFLDTMAFLSLDNFLQDVTFESQKLHSFISISIYFNLKHLFIFVLK